jgi:DNA polymerase III sliding clamp (beta) subunit (PCNA family)
MKTNEILKAITGSDKANKETKNQMKTLEQVFTLMKEIKNEIVSVEISEGTFFLGSYVQLRNNCREKDFCFDETKRLKAEKWTVKTAKGTYSQTIPTDNVFYFAFRALLSEFVPMIETQETKTANLALWFTKEQTAIIKTAIGFASTDSLRPAMNNIQIEIKKEGLINVSSTDGIRLYFEQFFTYHKLSEMSFLLPAKELKKIKSELEVELFKDEHNFVSGKINGIAFDLCTEPFPNYMNVWPQYEKFIEVDRAQLVEAVKLVLPFANKTTKQVNFHINGSVNIQAEDLDFCNETKIDVSYKAKTTPDFDISFNGKFLLECLGASKNKTVKMYSDGKDNRAVILDDIALLMPVMHNQYA